MGSRTSQLIAIVATAALGVALLGPAAPPPQAAGNSPQLAALRDLAARADLAAAASAPGPGERVSVLVQLDQAPLALLGPELDPAARAAHAGELAAAQDRLAADVVAGGGSVLARFSSLASGLAVRVDGAQLAALRARPDVLAVLPIGDYAIAQGEADSPVTLRQVTELVGSAELRRLGVDGSGVDIAVVDSGVDYTHRKLGGPGSSESYYRAYCGGALLRPGDPSCDPSIDPPPDLFPNQVVRGGYDYLGDVWPNPDERCTSGDTCIYPDKNPIDGAGHGTHVADIAAGRPLSSDGADAGVAPGANLWAFKACNGDAARCEGTALLLALDHALDLDGSDRGRCRADLGQICADYDPADIVVLAVSYSYGQPEDALTLFADIAGYYGALVVAAAGNDGDRPYIVGTPAVASASLAVAESTLSPAPVAVARADGATIDARLQAWSPTPGSPQGGAVRIGDGAGGNLDGCAPLPAWSGTLLLRRGGCSAGAKAQNAAAAGAELVVISDVAASAAPPRLRGSSSPIPVISVTREEGAALRAAAADGSLDLALAPAAPAESVAASASRGPRIADGALKPDLAAPGAITSAAAGTGNGLSAFGGSSGSAPVVAGAAALIVQELERRSLIDPAPGLRSPTPDSLSLTPLIKALLTNTAVSLPGAGGSPAAASLVGSGRLNALAAFRSRTLALDATAISAQLASDPALALCQINPYSDLIRYLFLGRTPECAQGYPGGDDLMRAWNAQSGSVSFGYQPASAPIELQRTVAVVNFSRVGRTYRISSSARVADPGVSVSVSPSTLSLSGGDIGVVSVTLRIDPSALGAGPADGRPYEVDGALLIDGGTNNRLSLPWYVMPERVGAVEVARATEAQALLVNRGSQDSGAEAFALVDISENQCDTRAGGCSSVDYRPGDRPGSRQSPPDIAYVGVRGRSLPGLNASYGLPAAPAGATPDELVEFAVSLHDLPYRATPASPLRIEVSIDANRDGSADYLLANADVAGRQAIVVRDVNPADGTSPERAYGDLDAAFHTRWWIMPVPAAAVGLRSDQPFAFVVRAYDGRNGGAAWDCSPRPVSGCGTAAHTFQTGAPAYIPDATSFNIPAGGRYTIGWEEDPWGGGSSPAQLGLLLLLRDAAPTASAIPLRVR